MSVELCVLLWARPGEDAALVDYEDQVLPLMAEHGGRVLQRVRRRGVGSQPLEVQILQFSSEAALERFMDDDRRTTLAGLRDRAIARSEVLRVGLVEDRSP